MKIIIFIHTIRLNILWYFKTFNSQIVIPKEVIETKLIVVYIQFLFQFRIVIQEIRLISFGFLQENLI